jgi:hypothetical protein
VVAAIARALVSAGEYFANVWSDAGEQGQLIMRALALGKTAPTLPIARTRLIDHDVLDNDGNFTVEMVKSWVKIRFGRV